LGIQDEGGRSGLKTQACDVDVVREYIRGQAEHHKIDDFQTEYRRFCEKNGKPLDERYAWD